MHIIPLKLFIYAAGKRPFESFRPGTQSGSLDTDPTHKGCVFIFTWLQACGLISVSFVEWICLCEICASGWIYPYVTWEVHVCAYSASAAKLWLIDCVTQQTHHDFFVFAFLEKVASSDSVLQ